MATPDNELKDEKTDASFARHYKGSIPHAYDDYATDLKKLKWERIASGANQEFCTRRSCWLTTEPCRCFYKYGGRTYKTSFFPSWLSVLTTESEDLVGITRGTFNSCNANWYSEASHFLNWRSDNEDLFKTDYKNKYSQSDVWSRLVF